jgi:hypothetical protein
MAILSRLGASETPEPALRPWRWTFAYFAFGLYCTTTVLFATAQTFSFAVIAGMFLFSFLAWCAPLNVRMSMEAGGVVHDFIRRASVLPIFALIARYAVETGAFARYLPGVQ